MKKLFFHAVTIALLSPGIVLFAQQTYILDPKSPFSWDGPYYETYWSDTPDYDESIWHTSLGYLARYSDVIGVGKVNEWENGRFKIAVDHALVGCTNGSIIVVHETKYPFINWEVHKTKTKQDFMPTNQSRIVFCVYTNDYGFGHQMYWNSPTIPRSPGRVLKNYEMRYFNRSWWYSEHDDGVLFTQFTNVIQAVRFDCNWTNYFYLCRDGVTSMSVRVQEDSFWDMRYLITGATPERVQFILDDPLVDPKHKNYYLLGDWSKKIPDE